MRFVIGLLALKNLPDRPTQILIEEPDRGIYPHLLKKVSDVLKKIVSDGDSQVILTTHSPYMLDYFEPNQVLFMSKDNKTGEVTGKRLSDDPTIKEALKHFLLGEVWTMKMDGLETNSSKSVSSS